MGYQIMANTNKAPKVTLNSIIFAEAPTLRELKEGESYTKTEQKAFDKDLADHIRVVSQNLASYFVQKTSNLDLITSILSATITAIPAEVEAARLAEEMKAKERDRIRQQQERQREEERKRTEKEIENKKKEMLKLLLDGGVDLAVAEAAVAAGVKNLAPAHSTRGAYERVTCTILGKQYDVPRRGNMSQELKEIMADEGFTDRDEFIEAYRDDKAENKDENKADDANDKAADNKAEDTTEKDNKSKGSTKKDKANA